MLKPPALPEDTFTWKSLFPLAKVVKRFHPPLPPLSRVGFLKVYEIMRVSALYMTYEFHERIRV